MALDLRSLHDDFGVEVVGVDLAAPMGDARFKEIEAVFNDRSVVLFRDQELDDDRQIAFSRRFGPLEISPPAQANDKETTYVGRVSNVDKAGRKLPSDHKKVIYLTGNYLWHTDSSFKQTPALASLLSAREVPPEGGETEFVSARAAYGRLDPARRAAIEDLTVIHDFVFSRSKVGADVVSADHAKLVPPVPQRLVRTNPATGAKNYFVGSHAARVVGWTEPQSRALLDDLLARATRPADIYRHHWRQGDLIIWDNRCALHRGRPWDADRYRRQMHRTTVAGAGPSITAG